MDDGSACTLKFIMWAHVFELTHDYHPLMIDQEESEISSVGLYLRTLDLIEHRIILKMAVSFLM